MRCEAKYPSLLLVEDDPVSRVFLADALAAYPAHVDAAESIASAIALIRVKTYGLCLIDAHLPDGDGLVCLTALRQVDTTIAALAITADALTVDRDQLSLAGFINVLEKPITVTALHAAVRRVLGSNDNIVSEVIEDQSQIWDQTRALTAVGGHLDILNALRKIFLEELPTQRQQIITAAARNDTEAVRAVLHKLKASCGFVGAARLLIAVQALFAAPLDTTNLREFELAIHDQLTDNQS